MLHFAFFFILLVCGTYRTGSTKMGADAMLPAIPNRNERRERSVTKTKKIHSKHLDGAAQRLVLVEDEKKGGNEFHAF
jgi:hypothetical protein